MLSKPYQMIDKIDEVFVYLRKLINSSKSVILRDVRRGESVRQITEIEIIYDRNKTAIDKFLEKNRTSTTVYNINDDLFDRLGTSNYAYFIDLIDNEEMKGEIINIIDKYYRILIRFFRNEITIFPKELTEGVISNKTCTDSIKCIIESFLQSLEKDNIPACLILIGIASDFIIREFIDSFQEYLKDPIITNRFEKNERQLKKLTNQLLSELHAFNQNHLSDFEKELQKYKIDYTNDDISFLNNEFTIAINIFHQNRLDRNMIAHDRRFIPSKLPNFESVKDTINSSLRNWKRVLDIVNLFEQLKTHKKP